MGHQTWITTIFGQSWNSDWILSYKFFHLIMFKKYFYFCLLDFLQIFENCKFWANLDLQKLAKFFSLTLLFLIDLFTYFSKYNFFFNNCTFFPIEEIQTRLINDQSWSLDWMRNLKYKGLRDSNNFVCDQ